MVQTLGKKYRVTPHARDDLKKIGRYTEQTWRKAQRNLYLKEIEARFHWLAENPPLGMHRTDISADYCSFPQGQHVIFYLIGSGLIYIIGIPHKEMDTLNYFQK